MPTRTPLNVYLLKRNASPADAVPTVSSTPPAQDAAAPIEHEQQQHVAESDSGGADTAVADDGTDTPETSGWLRTWRIDGELVEAPLPSQRDESSALLVRATPAAGSWLTLLRSLTSVVPVGGGQMNFGALLFQPIGPEIVVWSFGNGWMLIDPSTTVDRFGLRVGLNALLSSKAGEGGRLRDVGVRELTSALRASVVRKATVTTGKPASPRSMERIDQTSDAATMAQLTTHHRTFDRVSAGRSLRFDAPVESIRHLTRYGVQAVRLHRRKDYKSHDDYKWIDYTVPISDPDEVNAVLDELWAQATDSTPIAVDLVWSEAEPETGITPSSVRLPRERGSFTRPDLNWATALAWLQHNDPTVVGHAALRSHLRFYDDPTQRATMGDELWRYLVAQLSVGGDTFVLSDGEVWKASTSYVADVDAQLSLEVVVNPGNLPPYVLGEIEDTYNKRAALQGGHLLLDKSLLRLPGQTAIEAGDLLSASGLMMHVKRKSRSSTMSHAASQALVSAQLLRSDAASRKLLDDVLVAAKPQPADLQVMRDHCASFGGLTTAMVQIVIVGGWRGTPTVSQLPLLTRINLNGWVRQMPCPRQIALVGT